MTSKPGNSNGSIRYDLGLLRDKAPALADKVCASLKELAEEPLAGMAGSEPAGFDSLLDAFQRKNQPLQDELIALNPIFDLNDHLRRYLEERTRIHLVEHLKQRPEAWRAFNLLLLQTLQATLVSSQQFAAAERAEILRAVQGLESDWHGRDDEAILAELGSLERRLLEDAQRRHEELRDDHQALHEDHQEIIEAIKETQRPPTRPFVLHRPERAEKFTGRVALVNEVVDSLQPGEIVSLIGTGGIGKTAVAAEAIWRLATDNGRPERFPDGVLWYSFYGRRDTALATAELLRQTGGDDSGGAEAALRRALAGREYLIYLDGTEEADDLPALLALRDNNTVLISSRAHEDEHGKVIDVPFLPLEESKKLLRQWGKERVNNEQAAAEICELVGNLPLALRIAGKYMATSGLMVMEYLGWLRDAGLEALDFGERREKSVPALLAKSAGQVSEGARHALAAAGWLALAPFRAEAVAAALDKSTIDSRKELGELVNYGLLQRPDERYAVAHPLIHTFATDMDELDMAHLLRLAAYYTNFSEQESAQGPQGFAELEGERSHILQIVRFCEENEAWAAVDELVRAVDLYLDRQGYGVERITALEAGLRAARAAENRKAEGFYLANLGATNLRVGQMMAALDLMKQSLQIYQEIGDKSGEGTTLNNISQIYRARGDYETALTFLERSLKISQEIGDVAGLCATLFNMGRIYWRNEEVTRAYEAWITVYGHASRMQLAQALDALQNLAGQLGLEGGLEAWERLAGEAEEND